MRDDDVEITRPCPIDLRDSVARAIASERPSFHCGQCDRGVLVLSALRESEAVAALAQRGPGEMCVAYVRDDRGQLRFRPEPALVPAARLWAQRLLRASAVASSLGACTPHADERVEPASFEAFETPEPEVPCAPSLFEHTRGEIEDGEVVGGELPLDEPTKIPSRRGLGSTVVGGLAPTPTPAPLPPGLLISPRPIETVGLPLARVMARAIYSPEPDPRLLAQTKAARFDRSSGKNTTSFCVDRAGRVFDVETKRRFPGDPQVDAIIRKAISSWRFSPLEVDSEPTAICTQRTFMLKFE